MNRKRRWKYRLIKTLRYTNKLTAYQKVASRVGYMGAGFVIAGQWTIEPIFFIIGFICVIIQTSSRKQWNLVALNNKCNIYEKRPDICRVKGSKKDWIENTKICHILIDSYGLDKKYKIDLKLYDLEQ